MTDFMLRVGRGVMNFAFFLGLIGVVAAIAYGGMYAQQKFNLLGEPTAKVTITPDDKSREIARLTGEVGRLTDEVKDITDRAKKAEGDRKAAQGERDQLKDQLATAKAVADKVPGLEEKVASAESKVKQAEDKLAAAQAETAAVKTEPPQAPEQPAATTAKKPDVLWEGDLRSKRITARSIIDRKCGDGVEVSDLDRLIADAESSNDFRDKLVCPTAKEQVAGAPIQQTKAAQPEGGCGPGTVRMSRFNACVPVLNRR